MNRDLAAFLIVRDEEALLGGCLASIQPWVGEICVLDTGSSDATVQIARSFGAKVTSFLDSRALLATLSAPGVAVSAQAPRTGP